MLEKHFCENVADVQKDIYKQINHIVLPPFSTLYHNKLDRYCQVY